MSFSAFYLSPVPVTDTILYPSINDYVREKLLCKNEPIYIPKHLNQADFHIETHNLARIKPAGRVHEDNVKAD